MTEAHGIDVSRYQGTINWGSVKADPFKPEFAAIRATVGDYYSDPEYRTNYLAATNAGFIATAYHVIRMHVGIESQVNRLFNFLGDDIPPYPLCMDCETTDGKNPREIENIIRSVCELVEARTNKTPIIYTGDWWWNPNVPRNNWCQRYPLWVALYGTALRLPADWNDWLIWQYSSTGRLNGINANVDLNRWNGTSEDMFNFFGVETPPEPPEPPQPGDGLTMRVAIEGLRKRSGPGTNFERLGYIDNNSLVEVLDVAPSLVYGQPAVWAKINSTEWICVQLGSTRYVLVEQ